MKPESGNTYGDLSILKSIIHMNNQTPVMDSSQSEGSSQAEHELEIDGILTVPQSVTKSIVMDKLMEWAEQNGWTFGGLVGLPDYLENARERSLYE